MIGDAGPTDTGHGRTGGGSLRGSGGRAASADVDVETGYVDTNGTETYYERRGEGPPIVFVHGFLMDTRMWAPQVEALADDYTVVTYDVRGHGRTGGSDISHYSAELFADDLDGLLGALDLDRPVLCGLSMGGMIAQVYAATHPERVSGLVLSDTFTPGALPVGGGLAMPHLPVFALLSHAVDYKRLNRFQAWLGTKLAPGMVGDADYHLGLVDDGPTMPNAEFRKGIGAILAYMRGEVDHGAITVPTLVLYGEHEPSPIRRMAEYIADHVGDPDAEVAVVPGGGHGSSWDTPEFFTDAVRRLAERAHGLHD